MPIPCLSRFDFSYVQRCIELLKSDICEALNRSKSDSLVLNDYIVDFPINRRKLPMVARLLAGGWEFVDILIEVSLQPDGKFTPSFCKVVGYHAKADAPIAMPSTSPNTH
ncbi:hypothetical protein ACOME3_004767 [Neoechinorhynchus agilis]